MGFNFTVPPLLSREQSGALPDIIGDLLGSYTAGAEAKNLKLKLAAALTKQQLENKYYGPEKESEIGLRGAQSRHFGAQTQSLNISNPFLRQKLEQEAAKRKFELQNPFFGQTGTSGDLGRLLYIQKMVKENPDLFKQQNQNYKINPDGTQIPLPPMPGQKGTNQEVQPNNFDINSLIQNAFNKVTKADNGANELTTATKTSNQALVRNIDNSIPVIDDLIKKPGPGQFIGKYISPNKQAQYQSKTAGLTDALIGALGLPKIQESIHLVETMTKAQRFESKKAYIRRLKELRKDLISRRNRATNDLSGTNTNVSEASPRATNDLSGTNTNVSEASPRDTEDLTYAEYLSMGEEEQLNRYKNGSPKMRQLLEKYEAMENG